MAFFQAQLRVGQASLIDAAKPSSTVFSRGDTSENLADSKINTRHHEILKGHSEQLRWPTEKTKNPSGFNNPEGFSLAG
ncbi:hypothetical protein [Pseudomonas sp. MAG733B]|uniref:hypothetical protein n=1 Tax=Pseudomonas sp. MAG733B TaxID=3122079 RepID=UPI0030CE916F